MLSGDTRPLLLSPFTNPVLDRVLVNRFSAPDGQTASLSQLLIFVEESDIPGEKAGNIATLTRTLPLLFLPKLNYDARVVRCVMSEHSPGALMPVYLLLPTAALMMDRLGQKGYIITDREAVENLRLAFSRKYIDAVPVLKLATGTHGFMESVQLYSKLFAAHCGIGPAAADTVDERERFPRARGGVLPGCAGTGQNVLPRISDGGSPDDRGSAELSGGGQDRRPGAQPKIYGGFY